MKKAEKIAASVEAYKQLSDLLVTMSKLDMHVASSMKTLQKAEESLCSCEYLPELGVDHEADCALRGLKSYVDVVEELVALGETGLRPPMDPIEEMHLRVVNAEKAARRRAERDEDN